MEMDDSREFAFCSFCGMQHLIKKDKAVSPEDLAAAFRLLFDAQPNTAPRPAQSVPKVAKKPIPPFVGILLIIAGFGVIAYGMISFISSLIMGADAFQIVGRVLLVPLGFFILVFGLVLLLIYGKK